MRSAARVRASLGLVVCVTAVPAGAVVNVPHSVVFDQPGFSVVSNWRGSTLGVPGRLGGLVFSPNGAILYVAGNAGTASSGVWAIPVTRSAVTGKVTNLVGPATLVFTGSMSSLDAGLEYGPSGNFFHTYLTALAFGAPRWIAYRRGGITGTQVLRDLGGFPQFTSRGMGGLTFNPLRPDPQSGFGRMLVNDGVSENLIEVDLAPDGVGGYTPVATRVFVHVETRTNQGGLGQMHILPAPYQGDLMYVSYTDGELRIIDLDPVTGVPFVEPSCTPTCQTQLGTLNPIDVRFAHGFGEIIDVEFNAGPLGLEVDRLSNDLFVTTNDGVPSNVIFQIGGFSTTVFTTTTTRPTTTTSTSTTSTTSTSRTTTTSTSSSTSTTRTTSTTSSTSTSRTTTTIGGTSTSLTTSTTSSTSTTRTTSTTSSTSTSRTTTTVGSTSTSSSSSSSTSVSITTTSSTSTTRPSTTSTTIPTSAACGVVPRGGCIGVQKGVMTLREPVPGFERLRIVLRRADEALLGTDFGDPVTGTTRYDLCLYGDASSLVLSLAIDRAGQVCDDRPCWVPISTNGYRYSDRDASADGAERIVLKGGGAGRGRIVVSAGNDTTRGQLAFPAGAAAALEGTSAVTVQLVASDGVCVGGTITDVSRADGVSVRASGAVAPAP